MGIDLNKIVSFRKYYNSFMLFTILIAVFQMFIQFNFNADAIKIMSEVDYTIPVWFTSLNIIMILFLFVYQHYISLYIFDEQVKKIGILFGIGVNKGYICKYLYKKWCYFFLISVIGGISGTKNRRFYFGKGHICCREFNDFCSSFDNLYCKYYL